MSYPPNPQDSRRSARLEICYRCEIDGPGFAPLSALIVNISPHGCMIRCAREAPRDMLLEFTLPVIGAWSGRVIWAIGARMGLEFDQEISLDAYLPMLEQMSRPNDEMGVY